ncbi:uncharacterized protein LOC132638012 [Lycium barbarum]|uniref:uncharacterized protein LOC132638012 n=1 Tax=Lycium barbarum TaxID=112863 RepID=UPI00293E73A7|nr:uncharacterized protein LOC132638012 [Lycium barbarum]
MANTGKFSIKCVYVLFTPQFPKVNWKSLTMVQGEIPKHQFILWMAIQERLATVDRLEKWGIQVPPDCVLCNTKEMETFTHLFFDCAYARSMWKSLLQCLGMMRQITTWETEIQWLSSRVKQGKAGTHIIGWLFGACVYHV